MRTRKDHKNHIVLLLPILSSILLLLIYATKLTHSGASSTPKNLVNLYTNSPNNDNNLNVTNLSQFLNEYQYRQAASKLSSTSTTDRYKSTTQPSVNSDPSVFDHLPIDLSNNNAGTLDYSYHDDRGFTTNVPDCKGRLKLTRDRGFITDGAGFYPTNLQCVWLIDSGRNNATIRIQILQFNTECNYDYLYIFDGDSIYSPLVAALSGDMKDFSTSLMEANYRNVISNNNNSYDNTNSNNNSNSRTSISLTNQVTTKNELIPSLTPSISSTSSSSMSESHPLELKTYSGKAFIYFHSDTAQSMPGFYITYTINSCPLECSNRGECDFNTLKCKCNSGYSGDGCQYQSCPNNCTSIENGFCDKEKSCICNQDFYGNDCSLRSDQQDWIRLMPNLNSSNSNIDERNIIPPKAFHQSIIIDGIMYVIGGKTQALSNTNMGIHRKKSVSLIFSLNISSKVWTDLNLIGSTGIDHLAELTGHSVAAKGQKIFIYGGMAMNNTILNSLSVYDTKTNTLTSLISGQQSNTKIKSVSLNEDDLIPPIAVVGHTANIIDSHMYIFLGYNPLYGYLNVVQKFNLADNTWSLVGRKGSSISGYLGHTSTYDPVDGLVYIYGGHDAHRSNNLYSFDPNTEIWTFLQPGISPRYYHTAVIVNRQLIILGGNSYNISHQSDQCFQQTYLTYDLSCTKTRSINDLINNENNNNNTSVSINNTFQSCGRKCWQSVNEHPDLGVMKRHGHSIVYDNNQLILFAGFNGILMNDLRFMNLSKCEAFTNEFECIEPKLALSCYWNSIDSKCLNQLTNQFNTSLSVSSEVTYANCTKSDLKVLQQLCETRETCSDCLNTNQGCVWCGFLARCHYSKCKSSNSKAILDADLCYKDEYIKSSLIGINLSTHPLKDLQVGQDFDHVMECKRLENCYLCHSRPYCSWQNDGCAYNSPGVLSQAPASNLLGAPPDEMNDIYGSANQAPPTFDISKPQILSNSSRFMRRFDPFHRSLFATLTSNHLNTSPHSCDVPCYMRRSCNECTTTKCIWCSTSEQCIDSSAYFAYHAMGQCMHYVAHMPKCPISSCAGIETCDKCLTNPRCGWLNDISNSGKGRCIEGTSAGPIFGNISTAFDELQQNYNSTIISPSFSASSTATTTSTGSINLQSWFYTNCPSCQCNGHSYCRSSNNSLCLQPCQDFTEGHHCERCIQGYFGDPINGGICRPCDCNGHAQTCHKETGKCYCSTKGITGHTCNRCDDQNHYIGDLTAQGNGTCYYNLTTDYQYTFNMSKPEDHFYNDINFINVPLRKDSDLDFTIACSRLALVNITSGTSYKNRKPIHTSLECGSFRLRFPHDRHISGEANYSFFVHVYKFQTPFILQIAFSQHRTLYLPQFFFTFSSCFLFFFALSGLVWKLKHEYDIYLRRQRQFIEMEQMASRPFSTVLLEMFKPKVGKSSELEPLKPPPEPTPISFEPCFGNNVGVMSLFVQLPGRPNLAIASALVTLNDKFTQGDENKRNSEKEQVSV